MVYKQEKMFFYSLCLFIPPSHLKKMGKPSINFPTFPHSNIEDSSLDFYFCLTQQKQLFWDPSEEAIYI